MRFADAGYIYIMSVQKCSESISVLFKAIGIPIYDN
jgi:hypothetical protein